MCQKADVGVHAKFYIMKIKFYDMMNLETIHEKSGKSESSEKSEKSEMSRALKRTLSEGDRQAM